MGTIYKKGAPKESELYDFLNDISFSLPEGFIKFYQQANGADISSDNLYTTLWALTDMIQLNKEYDVENYTPEFFIFGSDGGGNAFAIEKLTGKIFEMPFIGMSKEEAFFKANTFDEFLELRQK